MIDAPPQGRLLAASDEVLVLGLNDPSAELQLALGVRRRGRELHFRGVRLRSSS